MENAKADATRVLPVVRRWKLGSIRYAHSGVGPVGDPGDPPAPARDCAGSDGRAGPGAGAAAVDEPADDRTRALPVLRPDRARGAERDQLTDHVRLTERVRRAGSVRLAERIRLTGRGCPPEIAHE